MKVLQQVIHKPIITEKSTMDRELHNVVTFAVNPRATKQEVKDAVEKLFSVKVEGVRTSRFKGKTRRMGRYVGHKPAWKKARVQLGEGESIEFFEGV